MSLWDILVPAESGVVHNTIANPSFEYNNSGNYTQVESFVNYENNGIKYWNAVGNATISRSNKWASQGSFSLKISTGTTTNSGVQYNPRLSIIDIQNQKISCSVAESDNGSLIASKYHTFAIMGLDDVGMSLANGLSDLQVSHTSNPDNPLWGFNPTIDAKRGHTDIFFTSPFQVSASGKKLTLTITSNISSSALSPRGYAIWCNVQDTNTTDGTYVLVAIVPNAQISVNNTTTEITITKVLTSQSITLVSNSLLSENFYISNRLFATTVSRSGTVTWTQNSPTVTYSNSGAFTQNDVGKVIYLNNTQFRTIGSNFTIFCDPSSNQISGAIGVGGSGFAQTDVGKVLFDVNNNFIGIISSIISIASATLLDNAAITYNGFVYTGKNLGIISTINTNTQVITLTANATAPSGSDSFTVSGINTTQNYSVYLLRNNQYLYLGKMKQFRAESSEIEFYENVMSANNLVNEPYYIANESSPMSFPENPIGGISSFVKSNTTYTPSYINLNATAPYFGITNSSFGDFTKSHHLYLDWYLSNNSENPNVSYTDTGALWSVYLYNNQTSTSTLLGTLDKSTVTSTAADRMGLRKKFLISRPSGNTSDMSIRILYTGASTSDANLYIDGVQFVDVGMVWRAYDWYGSSSSTYNTPMHFDDWDWNSVEFSYIDGDVPGAIWSDTMPTQSGTYQASFPYFTKTGVWHGDAYEYGDIESAYGYNSPRFRAQTNWRNESVVVYGVSIPGLSQSALLAQSTTVGFWVPLTNQNINVVVEPSTTGVGMPEIATTSLEYGIVDGGFVQRQIARMRNMQFTLTISAQSWVGLHANRRSLINLLKFDQLAQQGDRMLRYNGADTPIVTSVTYQDGLGYNGAAQNASFTELLQIRFLSSDPYFYSQSKLSQSFNIESTNANDKSYIYYKLGNNKEWIPLSKHYIENTNINGETFFYNADKTTDNAVSDIGWIVSPSGNVSTLVVGGQFEYPFSKIAFFFVSGAEQKNTNSIPQNTTALISGVITSSASSRILTSSATSSFSVVPQNSTIMTMGGTDYVGTVQSFTKTNYGTVTINNGTTISGTFSPSQQTAITTAGAIWINNNGSYTFVGEVTTVNATTITFTPAWSGGTQTNVILAYGGGVFSSGQKIVLTSVPTKLYNTATKMRYLQLVNASLTDIKGTVFGKQGFSLNGKVQRLYQDSPNTVIAVGDFTQIIETGVVSNDLITTSTTTPTYRDVTCRVVRFQLADTGRIIAESIDYIGQEYASGYIPSTTTSNLYSLLRYVDTSSDNPQYTNATIYDITEGSNNSYFIATQSNVSSYKPYDLFFPNQLTRSTTSFSLENANSSIAQIDSNKNANFIGVRITGLAAGTITYNSTVSINAYKITGTGTNFEDSWVGKSLFTIQGIYIGQIYYVESTTTLYVYEIPNFNFTNINFEISIGAQNIITDKNNQKSVLYTTVYDSSMQTSSWNTYVWAFINSVLPISQLSAIKNSRTIISSGLINLLGIDNSGTISVNQNSTSVSGFSTIFNSNMVGNTIIATATNTIIGQILSVTSTTQLVLSDTYTGITLSNVVYTIRPVRYFTNSTGYQSIGGIIESSDNIIAKTAFPALTTIGTYAFNDIYYNSALTRTISNVQYSRALSKLTQAFNPFAFTDTTNNKIFSSAESSYNSNIARRSVGKLYYNIPNSVITFPEVPANKGYTAIVDGAIDAEPYFGAGTISANITANTTTSVSFSNAAFTANDVGRVLYDNTNSFIGVIVSVTTQNAITITTAQMTVSSGSTYRLSGIAWIVGTGVISQTSGTTITINFASAFTTDNYTMVGMRIMNVATGEDLGIITSFSHSMFDQTLTLTVTNTLASQSDVNIPYAISTPLYMYNFALKSMTTMPSSDSVRFSNTAYGMTTSSDVITISGSGTTPLIALGATSFTFSGSNFSIADVGRYVYNSSGSLIGTITSVTSTTVITTTSAQATNAAGGAYSLSPIDVPISSATNGFFSPNHQAFAPGVGLITTTSNSRVLACVNTNFSQKDVGRNIYTTSGNYVGTIASVSTNSTANNPTVVILDNFPRAALGATIAGTGTVPAIALGNTSLTFSGSNFSSADVGKRLINSGSAYVGTITAVTSTTQITITPAVATATVGTAYSLINANYLIGLPYAMYAYINYMWRYIADVAQITNSNIRVSTAIGFTISNATPISLVPYTAIETSAVNYLGTTTNHINYAINEELYTENSVSINVVAGYFGTINNIRNLFYPVYSNANTQTTVTVATNTNTLTISAGTPTVYANDVLFTSAGNYLGVVKTTSTSAITLVANATQAIANAAGTITTTLASTTVTGVSTTFQASDVGRRIFNTSGALIGTIAVFTSALSVTLSANALVAVTGGSFLFEPTILRLASPGKTTISIYPYALTQNIEPESWQNMFGSAHSTKSRISSLLFSIAKTVAGSSISNYFADGIGYITGQSGVVPPNIRTNFSLSNIPPNDIPSVAKSIFLPNLIVRSNSANSSILDIADFSSSNISYDALPNTSISIGSNTLTSTGSSYTTFVTSNGTALVGRPIYDGSGNYIGTIKSVDSNTQLSLDAPSLITANNVTVYAHKVPLKYAIFPGDVLRNSTNQILGVVFSINIYSRTITLTAASTVTMAYANNLGLRLQRGNGVGSGNGLIKSVQVENSLLLVASSSNANVITLSSGNGIISQAIGRGTLNSVNAGVSTSVSISSAPFFTTTDVGKAIYNNTGAFIGTITSFVSGGQVNITLAAASNPSVGYFFVGGTLTTLTSSNIVMCWGTSFTPFDVGRKLYDFSATPQYIGTIARVINLNTNLPFPGIAHQAVVLTSNAAIALLNGAYRISVFEVGRALFTSTGLYIGTVVDFGLNTLTLKETTALVPISTTTPLYDRIKITGGGLPPTNPISGCAFFANAQFSNNITLFANETLTTFTLKYASGTFLKVGYANGMSILQRGSVGAGTITKPWNVNSITGIGTNFTQADVGKNVYTLDNYFIGTIGGVFSSTNVTLLSNNSLDFLNVSYVLVTMPFIGAVGTITTSTGSTTVTGVGTNFQASDVGRRLYTTGYVAIGTITAFTSTTSVTLQANAAVAVTSASFYFGNQVTTIGTIADHTTMYLYRADSNVQLLSDRSPGNQWYYKNEYSANMLLTNSPFRLLPDEAFGVSSVITTLGTGTITCNTSSNTVTITNGTFNQTPPFSIYDTSQYNPNLIGTVIRIINSTTAILSQNALINLISQPYNYSTSSGITSLPFVPGLGKISFAGDSNGVNNRVLSDTSTGNYSRNIFSDISIDPSNMRIASYFGTYKFAKGKTYIPLIGSGNTSFPPHIIFGQGTKNATPVAANTAAGTQIGFLNSNFVASDVGREIWNNATPAVFVGTIATVVNTTTITFTANTAAVLNANAIYYMTYAGTVSGTFNTGSTSITFTNANFSSSDVGRYLWKRGTPDSFVGTITAVGGANSISITSTLVSLTTGDRFNVIDFSSSDWSKGIYTYDATNNFRLLAVIDSNQTTFDPRSMKILAASYSTTQSNNSVYYLSDTTIAGDDGSGPTFTEVLGTGTFNNNYSATNNNITFTFANSSFTSADVGKALYVTNNVLGNGGALAGIIVRVNSTTSVTTNFNLVSSITSGNGYALSKKQIITDVNKKMYGMSTYAYGGLVCGINTTTQIATIGQRQFFLAEEPTQFTSQVQPEDLIIIYDDATYFDGSLYQSNSIMMVGVVTKVIDDFNLNMKTLWASTQESFDNASYSYVIVPTATETVSYTTGGTGYVNNDWQNLGRQNNKVSALTSLKNGDILAGGSFTQWADRSATFNITNNTVSSARDVYRIAKVTANVSGTNLITESYATPIAGTSYTANGVGGPVYAITDVSDINPINGYVGSADKVYIGGDFSFTMNNELLLPGIASVEGSTLSSAMRPIISIDFENINLTKTSYAAVQRIAASNRLRQYYTVPTNNLLDGINGSNLALLFDESIYANTKMQYTAIRVRGNASVYPVITIKNITNTNKSLMSLFQTETGAKIIFNNSMFVVFPNETVVIDLRIGKRSITSDVRGNVISYIHPLSNFVDWILIGANSAAGINTQSSDDYKNNVIGIHAEYGLTISFAYTPRFWSFDANNLFFGTFKAGL